jgi:hypothetical protein
MRPDSDREVALKEYFEARLTAIAEATKVAQQSMDKRLDGMNEFRKALTDQAANMVTRTEVLALAVAASGLMIGLASTLVVILHK